MKQLKKCEDCGIEFECSEKTFKTCKKVKKCYCFECMTHNILKISEYSSLLPLLKSGFKMLKTCFPDRKDEIDKLMKQALVELL